VHSELNYYPGQRIRCRGEEWQLTDCRRKQTVNGSAVWELRARAMGGIVQGEEWMFITSSEPSLNLETDLEVIDPANIEPVLDISPNNEKTKLFWEANLRRLLPRNGAIYLGNHGAFDKYKYQLEPAALALNSIRQRILIGDAVGLGKTVECGILLSELIRRGRGKRVLCVVPKAILEQFQHEMWGRFSIPFHRLDSDGLQKLRQTLPSTMNPFYHFDKVIVSVDTLKMKSYQKLLKECRWDVVIVDEAHNVAKKKNSIFGSQRHKLVKNITDSTRCQSVILMSATPHDGTREGFSSLVKLLDPTAIANDQEYTREQIEKLVIRRTKNSPQVAEELGDGLSRKNFPHNVKMSDVEEELLEAIHAIDFSFDKKRKGAQELFKSTLVKSLLSSPEAVFSTLEKRIEKQLKEIDKKKHDPKNIVQKDFNSLKQLRLVAKRACGKSSRALALVEYLKKNTISATNKVVIFTERLKTIDMLKELLVHSSIVSGVYENEELGKKSKNLVATVSGSDSESDIRQRISAFQKEESPVKILLATNVASEGLNLHYNCHRLVHFDLPWSLIAIEQRNGRIDRLGQTKQPQVHYFFSISKDKEHKDDLWIKDKIEARMNLAGADLAEESLQRGLNSSEEEVVNTKNYENKTIEKEASSSNSLADLLNELNKDSEEQKAYEKKLPSFFTDSPKEFVELLTKNCGLDITKKESGEFNIKVEKSLEYAIDQWPREFQPLKAEANSHLSLVEDQSRMIAEYDRAKQVGGRLNKSFMNEIHPAVSLLEEEAMGTFSANEVPVILSSSVLPPNSIAFLMQGSLYNLRQELVTQTWQLALFEDGDKSPQALFEDKNMNEALFVQKIVEELGCFFSSENQTAKEKDLKESNKEELKALALKSIEWMDGEMKNFREERAKELRPKLKEEHERIKGWEKKRKVYLQGVIASTEKDLEDQSKYYLRSSKKEAEKEFEIMGKKTKEFSAYVNSVFGVQEKADVKILGIIVS